MRMCCVSFQTQNVTVISESEKCSQLLTRVGSHPFTQLLTLTSHYHDVNVEVDTDFVNRKQVHQKYNYYYKRSGLSSSKNVYFLCCSAHQVLCMIVSCNFPQRECVVDKEKVIRHEHTSLVTIYILPFPPTSSSNIS